MSARFSFDTIIDRDRHIVGCYAPHCRAQIQVSLLLLTFLALEFAAEADAQVLYSWINASGGNYGSAANWFPGAGAPPDTPADGAEFGLSSTYTVDFFSNYIVGDAYVAAGDVTWFFHPLVGETLTYNAFGNVEVSGSSTKLTFFGGVVAANLLLISGGGDVVVLGADRNHAANINVTGAGSSLTHDSFLEVGKEIQGATMGRDETMTIQNGGTVTSGSGHIGADLIFGSAGTVYVIGAGSSWTTMGNLEVGDISPGTLNISDGGTVSTPNVNNGNIGVDADGTVNVTGVGSAWMIGGNPMMISGNLSLGFNQGVTGTLNITDGGKVSSTRGSLGFIGGSGIVNVSGAGSTWTNSSQLTIGDNGPTGILAIEAGGVVSNTNGVIGNVGEFFDFPASHGTVTVTGAGSTWTNTGNLTVGREGIGTLNIANGGHVSNSVGYVAFAADSEGDVTVTGPGSLWTNSFSLNIGQNGDGALAIENGGDVNITDGDGHVGPSPGSIGNVIVRGAGSTWNMTGDLFLGAQGIGTLTVENGGSVSSNSGNLARAGGAPFGNATATVAGPGSTWTMSGELRVGNEGTGMLNIQNGGAVSNANAFIATKSGSSGTVVVAGVGSSWTVDGRVSIAGDADTLMSGGFGGLVIDPWAAVNVSQDIVVFASGIVQLQGGTLDAQAVSFQGGGGFLFASGTLHVGNFGGNLMNLGGTLAPGHSAGSTSIIGNYTQHPGATLEIEIGGTSAGTSYDSVSVTGLASLDGELQLAMLNGFQPTGANTFRVLSATGGLSGNFSNVVSGQRLATIDDLGSFQINYGPGSPFDPSQVVLSNFIPNLLPGDFNDDGLVDAADYVAWRKNDGTQTGYDTWRANFGRTAGDGLSASGNATVPEPATLTMLMFAVAARCLRRSRAA